jgi:glyoxylase-like metal-dependent hydrolase (beta-lactamase superfamily II)
MNYRIRVLEVGYCENFPADWSFDGFYLAGETMFSPFCMTLFEGGGRNILIDCGIDMNNPKKKDIYAAAGAINGHDPAEVLGTVGLKPEDIDTVIITHLHWDHVGGAACYPNAVFYLQKEELERWEDVSSKPAWNAISCMTMDFNDLKTIRDLETEGRLILLYGEIDNLFPGISIRVSKLAHSFAQQMICIENDTDMYLVVGDVCNRPENLLGSDEFPFFIPNPKFSVGGAANALCDYEKIKKWINGDVNRVIMTHDGTRSERFPEEKTELGLSIYEIC